MKTVSSIWEHPPTDMLILPLPAYSGIVLTGRNNAAGYDYDAKKPYFGVVFLYINIISFAKTEINLDNSAYIYYCIFEI